jgi:hypothetical protein
MVEHQAHGQHKSRDEEGLAMKVVERKGRDGVDGRVEIVGCILTPADGELFSKYRSPEFRGARLWAGDVCEMSAEDAQQSSRQT